MVFSCLNYKYKYSFLIINFIHVFLTNKIEFVWRIMNIMNITANATDCNFCCTLLKVSIFYIFYTQMNFN